MISAADIAALVLIRNGETLQRIPQKELAAVFLADFQFFAFAISAFQVFNFSVF